MDTMVGCVVYGDSNRYMKMQRKLFSAVLLIAFTIVAGLNYGMSTMGMPGLHANSYSKTSQSPRIMTSQVTPSVPNWNNISYAKISAVRCQTPTPNPQSQSVNGVSFSNFKNATYFNQTYTPTLNTNASSIQHVLRLSMSERFFVNCTDPTASSNFTVLYFPSLANNTLLDTMRFIQIKDGTINTVNYSRTYNQKNDSIIVYPSYTNFNEYIFRYDMVSKFEFDFNISEAVRIFENTSLYKGANFIVELNYSFPISVKEWSMTTTSSYFTIEGRNTTHVVSYSELFYVESQENVLLTFYFIPAEVNSTYDYSFYSEDFNNKNPVLTQMTTPTFDTAVQGYLIAPAPLDLVSANSYGTLIQVTFNINATVGFTEINADRWTFDRLVASLDIRVRQYQLSVLQGPNIYLIENIRFNITDMYYANVFGGSNSSYPDGAFSFQNNTFPYYNTELESVINIPNGTQCLLGRIQKLQGPVTVSLEYNASYNATFHVLDEVRNPLPGAEIVLNYCGVRFGSLMAWNMSLSYPRVMTDSNGVITYTYLPEGNYTAMVYYQDRLVQTENFTLNNANSPLTLEIITTVPYAPTILIGWFVIFGILAILGVVLLKRKR